MKTGPHFSTNSLVESNRIANIGFSVLRKRMLFFGKQNRFVDFIFNNFWNKLTLPGENSEFYPHVMRAGKICKPTPVLKISNGGCIYKEH